METVYFIPVTSIKCCHCSLVDVSFSYIFLVLTKEVNGAIEFQQEICDEMEAVE
jgi:hypothetical protein